MKVSKFSYILLLFIAQFLSVSLIASIIIRNEFADESLVAKTIETILFDIIPIIAIVLVISRNKENGCERLKLKPNKRNIIVSVALMILYCLELCYVLKCGLYSIGAFYWLYYLIGIAFMEEAIYRALIPSILDEVTTPFTSCIFANVLFGACHLAIPVACIFAHSRDYEVIDIIEVALGPFILGVLFDVIRRRAGSIWICVILHALIDYGINVIRTI